MRSAAFPETNRQVQISRQVAIQAQQLGKLANRLFGRIAEDDLAELVTQRGCVRGSPVTHSPILSRLSAPALRQTLRPVSGGSEGLACTFLVPCFPAPKAPPLFHPSPSSYPHAPVSDTRLRLSTTLYGSVSHSNTTTRSTRLLHRGTLFHHRHSTPRLACEDHSYASVCLQLTRKVSIPRLSLFMCERRSRYTGIGLAAFVPAVATDGHRLFLGSLQGLTYPL